MPLLSRWFKKLAICYSLIDPVVKFVQGDDSSSISSYT